MNALTVNGKQLFADYERRVELLYYPELFIPEWTAFPGDGNTIYAGEYEFRVNVPDAAYVYGRNVPGMDPTPIPIVNGVAKWTNPEDFTVWNTSIYFLCLLPEDYTTVYPDPDCLDVTLTPDNFKLIKTDVPVEILGFELPYHVYFEDSTSRSSTNKWATTPDMQITHQYIRLYITAKVPAVSDLVVCNDGTGSWDTGLMIRLRSHYGLNLGFAESTNYVSNYTIITEGSGNVTKDGVVYHSTGVNVNAFHNIKFIFDRTTNVGYFYVDEVLYGTFTCITDIGATLAGLGMLTETSAPSCTYTSIIGFNTLAEAQSYNN